MVGTANWTKDGNKKMEPLFPRLHVSNTEKGGPRAPPRNKMALYEQFSVPSQKSTSHTKESSFSSHKTSSIAPATSSPNVSKTVNVGRANLPNVKSRTYPLQDLQAYAKMHQGRNKNEDNLGVSAFSSSGLCQQEPCTARKISHASSIMCSTILASHANGSAICMERLSEQRTKHQSKDRHAEDEAIQGYSESCQQPCAPQIPEHPCSLEKNSSVALKRKAVNSGKLNMASVEKNSENNDRILEIECQDRILGVECEANSRNSRENSYRSSKNNRCFNAGNEVKQYASESVSHRDENSCFESSLVESISVLEILPDDVVGVIGQNHFWKARSAIANHQRAFAVQVFELHRLIKVQKLIAASPHLLFENHPFMRIPSSHSPEVLPTSEKALPKPLERKSGNESRQTSYAAECTKHDSTPDPALVVPDSSVNRTLPSQNSGVGPCSATATSENQASSWCFPMTGYQWLVPVSSPSEGLIYKPYTGPCPPAGSFVVPMYGGFGGASIPPISGCFMNPACLPMSPQPHCMGFTPAISNYYSQGFPFMGSPASFGQASPNGGGLMPNAKMGTSSNANSKLDISSKVSGDKDHKDCMPCSIQKDGSVRGSTASRKSETNALGVLPPSTITVDVPNHMPLVHSAEQQIRAIRVIPHNPTSASESAAKIFKFIQEERRH